MSELILYKKMYSALFNDVTNVIIALDTVIYDLKDTKGGLKEDKLETQIELAIESLRKAQQKTERIYIER